MNNFMFFLDWMGSPMLDSIGYFPPRIVERCPFAPKDWKRSKKYRRTFAQQETSPRFCRGKTGFLKRITKNKSRKLSKV